MRGGKVDEAYPRVSRSTVVLLKFQAGRISTNGFRYQMPPPTRGWGGPEASHEMCHPRSFRVKTVIVPCPSAASKHGFMMRRIFGTQIAFIILGSPLILSRSFRQDTALDIWMQTTSHLGLQTSRKYSSPARCFRNKRRILRRVLVHKLGHAIAERVDFCVSGCGDLDRDFGALCSQAPCPGACGQGFLGPVCG